ncbi:MAG: hypothetical protein ACTSWL_03580 [Promethearchaeota archaeon]
MENQSSKYYSDQINFCITYANNKLGPRLVGNALDWNIDDFSKETLFSIIHDSLMMRAYKAIIFATNKSNVTYKVYILKIMKNFYDYRFHGEYFAYCFFLPASFNGYFEIKDEIKDFEWSESIGFDGSLKNLIQELKKFIIIQN